MSYLFAAAIASRTCKIHKNILVVFKGREIATSFKWVQVLLTHPV